MFRVNVDFNFLTYVPVSKTTRLGAVSSVKHTLRLFHHSVDLEAHNQQQALSVHITRGDAGSAQEPLFTNTITYFSNPA